MHGHMHVRNSGRLMYLSQEEDDDHYQETQVVCSCPEKVDVGFHRDTSMSLLLSWRGNTSSMKLEQKKKTTYYYQINKYTYVPFHSPEYHLLPQSPVTVQTRRNARKQCPLLHHFQT